MINIEQEAYGETPVNKDECTLYVSYYTENNNQASREGQNKFEVMLGYTCVIFCVWNLIDVNTDKIYNKRE